MSFNRLFNPLLLNADIALRDRGAAMLQKPLHKGNIKAVIFINLCCIPFAETVRADTVIAQIFTNKLYLLLDGSFSEDRGAVPMSLS